MSTTDIYIAEGTLPQTNATIAPPYYITVDYNELHAVAWTAASFADKQGSIAVAAIGRYSSLNSTQCTATFTPTEFQVDVNVRSTTIAVTPQRALQDFESTGSLVNYMMASFGFLSRISPNVVVSAIGTSLSANQFNYNLIHPGLNATTELPLRTMEASFAAVLDDLLLGEAAAQLALNQISSTVDVAKDFDAIQIGSLRYTIIPLVVNSVLIIISLLEAVRTRVWRDLPFFNPTNIKDVLAASSGATIQSRSLQPRFRAGDSDDCAPLARVRVRLDDKTSTLDIMTNDSKSQELLHPASLGEAASDDEDSVVGSSRPVS